MNNALEIHAHYSKLFEAFATLPPDDIGNELFERACELWAESPWNEFGTFLKRVESYLEQSQLSPERRARVAKFLTKQKPHYERGVWLVETRPRVIKHDEPDLKRRLSMGGIYPMFESVNPQDRNNHLAKVRAEVKRRLELLANQQELQVPATTELPQPVIPIPNLTLEEEENAYERRWDEFRNVVNISYSTPEDDATVTVYDVSGGGAGGGPPGLWCPMQCAGVPLESWQDYPEGKREAIRRGFMHGLCNMIRMTPPATLADWQYFRPEICKPVIYDRYFNPLNEQAHRTGDYAAGRREIEKWLTTIYAAGVQIPFHPNFENELTAHLGRMPLTGVDAFLAGFAQRKGLATPEGYTYLLNVAIEAPEAGRRTVMERVVSWLRLALDTPAPPATTVPPQPGSPAPNKGCPHLGDTLDTAPAATPTVADLCRQPFTPADLNRLLTSLNVLTEKRTLAGPTYRLSGSTVGKGAVRISKTFAALTELNENGLLNWFGWEAVMKAPPYGLTFGEKVLSYEYESKNTRRQSNTFDAAIKHTQRWLNRWRTAYNSQKQS